MTQRAIEDHGVIGDLYTVALVASGGCIDFMCFPQFDSPTMFASLLDEERGGSFRVAPSFDGHAKPADVHARHQRAPHALAVSLGRRGGDGLHARRGGRPGAQHRAAAPDGARRDHTSASCVTPRFDYAPCRATRVELDGTSAIFRSKGEDGLVAAAAEHGPAPRARGRGGLPSSTCGPARGRSSSSSRSKTATRARP